MNREAIRNDQTLKPFLLALGLILIFTGSLLSLFLGYLAYEALSDPQNFGYVKFLNEFVQNGKYGKDFMIGEIAGQPIKVEFSDAAVTLSFFFLSLFAIMVLLLTAKLLIDGGAALFKIYTQPLIYTHRRSYYEGDYSDGD